MEDAASSLQVPIEQLRASESRRAAVLTLRTLAQDVAPAAVELFDPLVADVLKRLEAGDSNGEAEVSGDGSSAKAATGRGDGNARQCKRGADAGGDAAALRRALAAAIAVISGHTTPPLPRSMITSQEGFVTFLIRAKGGRVCHGRVPRNPPRARFEPSRCTRGTGSSHLARPFGVGV